MLIAHSSHSLATDACAGAAEETVGIDVEVLQLGEAVICLFHFGTEFLAYMGPRVEQRG
jgi:hypothetical protein